MTYIRWCAMVDSLLAQQLGVGGRDDVPDAPWADWFAEGLTPAMAVATYIEDIEGVQLGGHHA